MTGIPPEASWEEEGREFFEASVPALATEVPAVEVEEKIVLQDGVTEHVAAEETAHKAAEEAALGAAGDDKQGDKAWTRDGVREKGLSTKGREDKGAVLDVGIGLTGEVGTTKAGEEVVTEGVEGVTEEETVGGVTTIAGTPGRVRDVMHVVDAGLEDRGLEEEEDVLEEVVVLVLEDLGFGLGLEGCFFLLFFFQTSFQSDSWSDSDPDSKEDKVSNSGCLRLIVDDQGSKDGYSATTIGQ